MTTFATIYLLIGLATGDLALRRGISLSALSACVIAIVAVFLWPFVALGYVVVKISDRRWRAARERERLGRGEHG